jgi:genome maintenance exonuclease 1
MFTHGNIEWKPNYGIELKTINDNGRKYVTPEGKFSSITTILGYRDRYKWAKWRKQIGEKEANRITRHATTRGTKVHGLAEDYLNNVEIDTKGEMPHHIQSFNVIKKVCNEHIGKVYAQEVPLYSIDLKTAGRVDCIAEFDGELSIVDFKTSGRIKTEDEISNYFMQECAYAHMFEEGTGVPIKQLVTIMVVDNDPNPIVFKQRYENWIDKLREEIKYYYDNTNRL